LEEKKRKKGDFVLLFSLSLFIQKSIASSGEEGVSRRGSKGKREDEKKTLSGFFLIKNQSEKSLSVCVSGGVWPQD